MSVKFQCENLVVVWVKWKGHWSKSQMGLVGIPGLLCDVRQVISPPRASMYHQDEGHKNTSAGQFGG